MDTEHDQKKVETTGSKPKPKDQRRGKPSTRYYHTKKEKQKQKKKQNQKDGDSGDVVDGSPKEQTAAGVKGSTTTGEQDSINSKPSTHKSKLKVKKDAIGTATDEGAGADDVNNPSKVKPTSKLKPNPKAKEKTKPKVKPKPKPNTDINANANANTKAKTKAKAKNKTQGSKANPLRARTRSGKKKFSIAKRREFQRRKMEASRGFKLVLRLLPPGLTEDEFVATLKPIFEEASIETRGIIEIYFVPGSGSLALFQEVVYSRGYLVFEEFEQMRQFATRVAELVFVDSGDNASKPSLQVSPYFKTLDNSTLVAALSKPVSDTGVSTVTATDAGDTTTATATPVKNQKKSGKRSKAIEGTIENTELFKMFVKSIAAIDKGETSSYMTENVSLLKSMDKELEKEKERLDAIERRTNSALLALAGGKDTVGTKNSSSGNSSNIKKKKKKRKKKEKEKQKVVGVSTKEKEKSKQKGRQITRVKNNVIIIEEAGRREMERRKELSLGDLKKKKDKEKEQEEEKPLKIKRRAEAEAGTCR